MQQFLNFFPLPQGQGSFRPTFLLGFGLARQHQPRRRRDRCPGPAHVSGLLAGQLFQGEQPQPFGGRAQVPSPASSIVPSRPSQWQATLILTGSPFLLSTALPASPKRIRPRRRMILRASLAFPSCSPFRRPSSINAWMVEDSSMAVILPDQGSSWPSNWSQLETIKSRSPSSSSCSRSEVASSLRPPDLRIAWVDGRWAYVLPELGFGRSLSERTRMRGGKWKWFFRF